MLESFRNLLSGKTLYVIVGICAIPFIFTGVSSFGTIFSNYGTVNGLEVSQVDVNSASGTIEQRYKSIFGESFTLDQLDEDELFELLKTQIVNQKMIESSAIENRLGVSIDDAKKEIIKLDSFKDENGKFDQSIFEATIRGAGLIPDEYIELVASSIASDNLVRALGSSFFILDEEIKSFIAANEVSRDIKFLKSNNEKIVDSQPATLVEAEAFYNDNNLLFLSDETRRFSFIKASIENYADGIDISDDLLEDSYQDYLNEANNSIQNRISHIMIDKSNYASESEANALINKIFNDIKSGKTDFLTAVNEYSEDEASIEESGDLGYSSGDAFPEEFESVIAKLKLNEVSASIDLGDTLHLIKLTEVLKPEVRSKSEIISELREEIILSESASLLNDDIGIAEELIISGANFEEIATTINLEQQDTNLIAQDEFESLLADIDGSRFFDRSLLVGDNDIIETEDGFYIIGLAEINAPSLMTFDSSVELALQEVRKEKANALIQSMNDGAFLLIDDQGLDIPSGFEVEEYKAINKFSSLLPMDVISQIFSSSINENIITVGSDGNNYWIKMQSENIPTDEEINGKVDDYRSYFIQYITQKNSSLVDQKIREGLRVDLKNLQPQA